MMWHPGMKRLHAFATGEHDDADARVNAHLARCAQCRATISFVRSVRAQIAYDEFALPTQAWDAIAERLASGAQVLLPVDAPPPARHAHRAGAIAAAALVVLTAAAAAVPGSPLRSWIEARIGSDESSVVTPAAATPPAVAPAAEVIVPVGGEQLTILIAPPTAPVQLSVRWHDGADVRVRATGPAVDALFRRSSNHLEVSQLHGGEIELTLPRTGQVRVALGERTVLEKNGAELRVLAATADTAGPTISIPLTR